MKITKPGAYDDLAAVDYHAQTDWLSWSMMKRLVPPSTPAHLRAALDAPEERKRAFDIGKVAHALILGNGEQFEVVQAKGRDKTEHDAEDYKTVSAREHRDAIYERGDVPILREELEQAQAMANAVRNHPTASALFAKGKAEVSLFWVDETTGVKCRARLDWLPETVEGRRLLVPDLKTAQNAAPTEFAKAAANHGYYGQQTHYLDGVRALGIASDPAFLFVAVEKALPHLVSVSQITEATDTILARNVVEHCRRLWADCLKTNTWPGYSAGVSQLSLPMWWHYTLEDIA